MKHLLLLLLLFAAPGIHADPRRVVEDFQAALTSLAGGNLAEFDARYAHLEPAVEDSHDLDYIVRLTLGRHWSGMIASQREAFAVQFGKLAVANYAARFANFDGARFETAGVEPQPRGIMLVKTRLLRPNADAVEIDYMLREREAGWKIVNILVDGVSDLALKRAEFAAALRDGSVEELLTNLEDQFARLQQSGADALPTL